MPAWTPGYYQLLHFADKVSDFKVAGKNGKEIEFVRAGRNGWRFASRGTEFNVQYNVKATRAFVATPFVDQTRGYIAPTGVFMHINSFINLPVSVSIEMPEGWKAATGLTPTKVLNTFAAPDFDVLYDSPILLGPVEELPAFEVKGVPHRFIGYKLGDFDRGAFMNDLKKIVEESVAMIGHIPYNHYTFLGIGPGQGGIEHLNSTTFGFSGESLKSREGRNRMYSFLAHEYFHHYNVKRIRPIELGPFDYDKENRTNMLWVSEGITVYYDLLLVRRAGLITDDELLEGMRRRLLGFENKPGRLYQSATQASYSTWSDGPFGRTDDEINKTVSVYDKGAIVGWLLDFAIRHETNNKKSLDDVMRKIYSDFYLDKKRGFTEAEFKNVCEEIAGTKLDEVFSYASTVKELDYQKYLAYGGIEIEIQPKQVEGAWLGVSTRTRNDSLLVTNVEYESPAWKAGVKRGMKVLKVNEQDAKSVLQPMLTDKKSGESISLQVIHRSDIKTISIPLATKIEPSFRITRKANPTTSQIEIFEDWIESKVER
jgi:predicted metalloprotease with PDZ domain